MKRNNLRFRTYPPKPKKFGAVEVKSKRYFRYIAVADPLAEKKAKLDIPEKSTPTEDRLKRLLGFGVGVVDLSSAF